MNSGTSSSLISVRFFNADTGYASGGALLKTEDGGIHWDPPRTTYRNVFFPTPDTGYGISYFFAATVYQGSIYKTIDAGKNWIQIKGWGTGDGSAINAPLEQIYCTSSNACVTGGAGSYNGDFTASAFLKTSDAGLSWTAMQGIPNGNTSAGSWYSIHFPTPRIGYVISMFFLSPISQILKTTDSGNTWSLHPMNIFSSVAVILESIYFPTETLGYAVGGSGVGNPFTGVIYKSIDGGVNWVKQDSIPNKTLHSVYFINEKVGYAVGDSGTILGTRNGGSTWTSQNSGTLQTLHSVYFPVLNIGFAVGDSGTVLKCEDAVSLEPGKRSRTSNPPRQKTGIRRGIDPKIGTKNGWVDFLGRWIKVKNHN